MGEAVPPEYGPMIAAELGLGDPPPAPERVPEGFSAIVVGAGISGLATSIRLAEAGIPHTVLERNPTVGGTWLENRYPGAGVDTPSALYSFSFAQQDWSMYFALRDELHGYLERLADDYGVRDRVRFNTEVRRAAMTRPRSNGSSRPGTTRCAPPSLITAVGGFNKPKWPSLPLEHFEGPVVHTARWPDDLELAGQRVGVIGNGASRDAVRPGGLRGGGAVTVFQRSPQWAAPFDQFHQQVPEGARWLMRNVPLYRTWYRLRPGWTFNDKVHPSLQKDPAWEHPDRSVNEINDGHRSSSPATSSPELGDRPDLVAKVLPDYPPFGKRILLDNGWYASLRRDDVSLVTDPITSITPTPSMTSRWTSWSARPASTSCASWRRSRCVGRGGVNLHEFWERRGRAGLSGHDRARVPEPVHGLRAEHAGRSRRLLIGSAEAQLHHIMDLLERLIGSGAGALEVRAEVYEDYNAASTPRTSGWSGRTRRMETYYRNSHGRVVVTTPFRVVDYWHMTRAADLGRLRARARGAGGGGPVMSGQLEGVPGSSPAPRVASAARWRARSRRRARASPSSTSTGTAPRRRRPSSAGSASASTSPTPRPSRPRWPRSSAPSASCTSSSTTPASAIRPASSSTGSTSGAARWTST